MLKVCFPLKKQIVVNKKLAISHKTCPIGYAPLHKSRDAERFLLTQSNHKAATNILHHHEAE